MSGFVTTFPEWSAHSDTTILALSFNTLNDSPGYIVISGFVSSYASPFHVWTTQYLNCLVQSFGVDAAHATASAQSAYNVESVGSQLHSHGLYTRLIPLAHSILLLHLA